ncbi:MAG: hypothetical protein WAM73_04890, partial [Desulfobacterales bacterium]
IIPQDCAGYWPVCKAHPAAHIEIRVGGCNAVDGSKVKQDVELFFAGTLKDVYGLRPTDCLTVLASNFKPQKFYVEAYGI